MAQPHPAQAQHARTLIIDLGQLLADITAQQDARTVHERLLEQYDAADHDTRIDSMQLGQREFADVWEALRQGLALPETAWEQVVLPVVVVFSNTQTAKTYLELAATSWLTARAAVDAAPGYPAVIAALADSPATLDSALPASPPPRREAALRSALAADAAPAPAAGTRRPRTGRERHTLVAVAVAVLATVAVMAMLVYRPIDDNSPVSTQSAAPSPQLSAGMTTDEDGQEVTLPTTPPTASPTPSAAITDQPTPKPSWTPLAPSADPSTPVSPPPPAVAPTAPTKLTATAADQRKVWLSWSAPANGGSGGIAYYQVFRDGVYAGWGHGTSILISGLSPGTAYRFVVYAWNAAGLKSPPSNQIKAVTASAPAPSSPAAPASVTPSPSAPPTSAAPSPTASPTDSPPPSPSESASPSAAQSTPVDPNPASPVEPSDPV